MAYEETTSNEETKPKTDEEFIRIARDRYDTGREAVKKIWEEAKDDIKFLGGVQWPVELEEARKQDNRPCLVENRLPVFIRQVVGDQRQFKPSIKARPVDSNADIETAEAITDIVRHIENNSKAKLAYDNAFSQALGGGLGYFKITTDYADYDAFDQDILIERIINQFGVVFDPAATQPDGSDARWVLVTEWITEEEFKLRWPNEDPIDFEAVTGNERNWFKGKKVLIAEYWRVEDADVTIALLSNGDIVEKTEYDELSDEIKAELTIIKERETQKPQIKYCLMSGKSILEERKWKGRYLPVIRVVGEENCIDGEMSYHSLIRFAKDPQRMYNYMLSASVESIALAPKAPFIGTIKQFEGRPEWTDANLRNYSYLAYNPDGQAPPPQRQSPPQVSSAILHEKAAAVEGIKATTGLHDASLGMQGNEQSGKAIMARQREGDTATYIFVDNFTMSLNQAGRVLVDLIPHIYDTPRQMKIRGEDGVDKDVQINQLVEGDGGVIKPLNDVTTGKYDVVIETGMSYATKRIEAAESMERILAKSPELMQIIGDLYVANQDWPEAEKIAKRLKKLVRPDLLTDDEREEMEKDNPEPLEPPPPTPEQELEAEELKLKGRELELKDKELDVKALEIAQNAKNSDADLEQKIITTVANMQRNMQGGEPPEAPPAL